VSLLLLLWLLLLLLLLLKQSLCQLYTEWHIALSAKQTNRLLAIDMEGVALASPISTRTSLHVEMVQ